ncbi:hypothetical protein PTTG_02538 [Puccinia triticina 1-1 BBBD Race 1]|uniref:Uncharacterized protein n=1 Tax=Puccinia triticina (isolate 1-1 / race 1 (BBBD)) TaxID=630390 RepID=A0A180GJH9_PUCT1|nr:hypothetical protein PTTG_02538 [Puccinia triticina 1-1 BBBD Race 1]WAR55207.1 hypothetical protein PtB15_4B827 [Puccinia triticina]
MLKELDISVVGASEKGQATSLGPSTPMTTQTSTNTTTTAGTSSSSAGPTGRVPGTPEIGGLSSNDEHVPKPGHPSALRARGSPSHEPTKEASTDSIGPSGILRCHSPSVASSATSTLPSHSESSKASSDLDIDPLGLPPISPPRCLLVTTSSRLPPLSLMAAADCVEGCLFGNGEQTGSADPNDTTKSSASPNSKETNGKQPS